MSAMAILRKTILIIVVLIILAAGALSALLFINRHDQPPSPEAKEFQTFYDQRSFVEDEKNGYIYLMGFDVPELEDPFTWGVKRVKWTHDSVDNLKYDELTGLPGPATDFLELRASEVRQLNDICKQPSPVCIRDLESNSSVVDAWLVNESWVINRYSHLVSFNEWLETGKIDFLIPLPGFWHVMNAQRVYLISIWSQIKNGGHIEDVDNALTKDLKFWRNVLKNADTLITKMIAVVAINNNFYWGNQIARMLPKKQNIPTYAAMLAEPLSQQEMSTYRVFVGEWIFLSSSIKPDVLSEQSIFFGRFLLQPQDTKNYLAKALKDLDASLSIDFQLLPGIINNTNQESQKHSNLLKVENMYNFTGVLLQRLFDANNYTNYVVRVTDLEGARRAVVLISRIRNEVTPEEIGSYIESAQERNPYNQAPFIWDEEIKELVFVGLEQGDRATHRFPL